VSPAGCSCRRLQRHYFDLLAFISRLLGAANRAFSLSSIALVEMNIDPKEWPQKPDEVKA
jgi:hypothetical protein